MAITHLPPLRDGQYRNPDFWSDREVRDLVVKTHRQMGLKEAVAHIAAIVGTERAPSQSALARAWLRLDKAMLGDRMAQHQAAPSTLVLRSGIVRRPPHFWADDEVRQMAVELHRQVSVRQALDLIAERVGRERTPSMSALARTWKRLDPAPVSRRKR